MDARKAGIWAIYGIIAAGVIYVLRDILIYTKERMDSPFKYFTWSEFDTGATKADIASGVETYFSARHGNNRVTGSAAQHMSADFIRKLDAIREEVGFPLIINSGYRSQQWNSHVGGSTTSSHMKGVAVDIRVINDMQRHAIVKAALKHGVNRFGWGRTYVHLDIDRQKSPNIVWGYRGGPAPPSFASLQNLA